MTPNTTRRLMDAPARAFLYTVTASARNKPLNIPSGVLTVVL